MRTADEVTDSKPALLPLVVVLDPGTADCEQVARLPGPGEVVEHWTAQVAGEDLGECVPLLDVAAVVNENDEVVWRPRLVVAVAHREHDAEIREVDLSGPPIFDPPKENTGADPVRRAPARDAVDSSAGADCVAVARLEVATAYVPRFERSHHGRIVDGRVDVKPSDSAVEMAAFPNNEGGVRIE